MAAAAAPTPLHSGGLTIDGRLKRKRRRSVRHQKIAPEAVTGKVIVTLRENLLCIVK